VRRRLTHLRGHISNWIDPSFRFRTQTKSIIAQKCVTFKRLSLGPMAYLFEDLFPRAQQDVFDKLCAAIQDILTMDYDALVDEEGEATARATLQAAHLKGVRLFCDIEKIMPNSVLTISFHQLLHLPTFCFKWNHVRNFWSFFNERSNPTSVHPIPLRFLYILR
jgi:hypothetical protein